MFKKYKQAAEQWLRTLIADEAGKIDADLHRERVALRSQLMAFDGAFKVQLQAFKDATNHFTEVSQHSIENAALRDTVKQLNAQIAEVDSTIKLLHPVT